VLAEPETEEAHAGHRVDHGTRNLVLRFDLSLERREPLLDELADRALEHDEVVRQDRSHQASFAFSRIVRSAPGLLSGPPLCRSSITWMVEASTELAPSARSVVDW